MLGRKQITVEGKLLGRDKEDQRRVVVQNREVGRYMGAEGEKNREGEAGQKQEAGV